MPELSDLTREWIDVWTHVRQLEVTRLDGHPLVHTRSRTRESELICGDPGTDAYLDLLSHIDGDPRAMLTVIADDVRPYDALKLPPGVRVDRDDESLMSATLIDGPTRPIDPAFAVRWDIDNHRAHYMIESGERIAAEGTVGVLGTIATFDAVETSRNFRRQGLGRHVMGALTQYAVESGGDSGVLAATPKGRALYEALGWQDVAPMRSYMGQLA